MIDLRMTSAALAMLILTAGCSRTDNEPGPGGVTVDEAKALDEAAEMLEQRRLPDHHVLVQRAEARLFAS